MEYGVLLYPMGDARSGPDDTNMNDCGIHASPAVTGTVQCLQSSLSCDVAASILAHRRTCTSPTCRATMGLVGPPVCGCTGLDTCRETGTDRV